MANKSLVLLKNVGVFSALATVTVIVGQKTLEYGKNVLDLVKPAVK